MRTDHIRRLAHPRSVMFWIQQLGRSRRTVDLAPHQGGVFKPNRERLLGNFVKWLFGVEPDLADPAFYGPEARLFRSLLPCELQECPAEMVAEAASKVALCRGKRMRSLIRFIFSSLAAQDEAKAASVFESLLPVTPREDVPALVQAAIMSHPRLAVTIVRSATNRVPEEAARIHEAAAWVVVKIPCVKKAAVTAPRRTNRPNRS